MFPYTHLISLYHFLNARQRHFLKLMKCCPQHRNTDEIHSVHYWGMDPRDRHNNDKQSGNNTQDSSNYHLDAHGRILLLDQQDPLRAASQDHSDTNPSTTPKHCRAYHRDPMHSVNMNPPLPCRRRLSHVPHHHYTNIGLSDPCFRHSSCFHHLRLLSNSHHYLVLLLFLLYRHTPTVPQ